jgi:hypothetical protein
VIRRNRSKSAPDRRVPPIEQHCSSFHAFGVRGDAHRSRAPTRHSKRTAMRSEDLSRNGFAAPSRLQRNRGRRRALLAQLIAFGALVLSLVIVAAEVSSSIATTTVGHLRATEILPLGAAVALTVALTAVMGLIVAIVGRCSRRPRAAATASRLDAGSSQNGPRKTKKAPTAMKENPTT